MKKTVLLGVTGSVAAYKACEITSGLCKAGIDVVCVMTKGALEFITPLSLKSLSGNQVFCDMFGDSAFKAPLHTSLADQADILLIAPASCNVIARLAQGLCDDLLTSVAISTRAPIVIAPAMNDNMYNHPATIENIKRLKKWGVSFIEPVEGHLVCGRTGIGHLAPVDEIVSRVKSLLHAKK
ncbi:MAG: flavoprotein [Candidatus Omnitrophica bacterium]|nr:flavoprotein [Candidatus Omnitrophota bacterium]